jgi:ribosomal protein L2
VHVTSLCLFSSARFQLAKTFTSMFSAVRAGTQLLRTCSSSQAAAVTRARSLGLPSSRFYATEVQSRSSDINAALSRTTALFKTYKPVSPGIRHLKRPINDHLWKGRPIQALTSPLRRKGGRNNHGRIVVRHIGGGHKRRLRLVDFMRVDEGPQDVVRIEYDPGRSAHIALLRSREPNANNGLRYSYILAPEGLRSGDVVQSFRNGVPAGIVPGFDGNLNTSIVSDEDGGSAAQTSTQSLMIGLLRAATVRTGNVLPLKLIPPGTPIHCVSLFPERKMNLVRSAGTFATVVVHEDNGKYTQVKLQSGEVRLVLQSCCAAIGKVSNPLWRNRNLGKAGRSRWLGRRPHVRGTAMNRYCVPIASFDVHVRCFK